MPTLTLHTAFLPQIRRMVGLGLQVANDKVTLDELRVLISDPTANFDPANVHKYYKAPPEGLSYVGGEYDPALLEGETDDVGELPVGPAPLSHNWRPKIAWDDKDLRDRLLAITDPGEDNPSLPSTRKECKELLQKGQQTAD